MFEAIYALFWVMVFIVILDQARKNNQRFIYLLGFCIPFFSFSLMIFVQLAWYKIIPIILFLAIVLTHRPIYKLRGVQLPLLIITIYMMLCTLINYGINLQSGRFEAFIAWGMGPARVYLFMVIQLLFLLSTIWILLFSPSFIRDREDCASMFNGFISGNVVNVFVGIYQQFAFYLGLPYIKWWYMGVGKSIEGGMLAFGACTMNTSIGTFYRMSGFGGEPKQFAQFLMIAIFLLIVSLFEQNPFKIQRIGLKLVILCIGIFWSFSVSALLGLLLGFGVIIFLYIWHRRLRAQKVVHLTLFIIAICVIFLHSSILQTLLKERILDRVETLELIERGSLTDARGIDLLKRNPAVMLMGAGSGGTTYAASDIRKSSRGAPLDIEIDSSETPTSFWIRHVTEGGIVGSVLLIIFIYAIIRYTAKNIPQHRIFISAFSFSVLAALGPTSGIAFTTFMVLLSSLYGYARHAEMIRRRSYTG